MDFLSNLFHSIGNVISGGNTNPQPTQNQPRLQAPVNPQPAPANLQPLLQKPQPVQAPLTVQAPQAFSPNQLTSGTLAKAAPIQQSNVVAAPAPTPGPSIIHDITHNPVTNVLGGIVKAVPQFVSNFNNTFANLGNRAAGRPNQTIQQNEGGSPILDNFLKMDEATGKNAQLAGDVAQIGTAIAAPGIDALASKVGSKVISDTAPALLKKFVPKIAGGAANGAAFNAENTAGNGGTTDQILKSAGAGLVVGGVLGGATGLLPGKVPLNKVNTATDISTPLSAAVKAPDELAVGIKSVNPTQVADAVGQGNQKIAQANSQAAPVDNTPSYQKGYPTTPTPAPLPGSNPTGLDAPTFQHNQNIQGVVNQGNSELNDWANTHPQATPQEIQAVKDNITQQVTERVNKLHAERHGEVQNAPAQPPLPPVEPVISNAMHPTETAALTTLNDAGKTRVLAPEEKVVQTAIQAKQDSIQAANEPVQPPTTESPQSTATPSEPTVNSQSTATAPNAPNVQAGFSKELGTDTSGTHEVMQKQVMQERAVQNAQTTDLQSAIDQHSSRAPSIQTPQDAFNASALMRRMYDEAKSDPASVQARNNLAESIADYGSRGGTATNVMADMTANLPPDAKANVITKSLSKLWGDDIESNPKAPAELKTLAGQSQVQAVLTDYLEQGENLNKQAATLQGKLNDIAEKGAASTPEDTSMAHDLGSQLKDLELQTTIKNAEALTYYDALTPKSSITERMAQSGRTAMLSSPLGRLNNGINVTGNTAYETLRAQIQGVLGKVINAVAPSQNAIDTGLVNQRSISGAVSGAKTAVAEAKNGRLVDDLGSTIWNKSGGDLSKPNEVLGTNRGASGGGIIRKAGNLVKAAVTAPRNILGGSIKDSSLLRLSRQEGMALGKTGDELEAYAAARSYVPSDQVAAKSQELQDQVSHTNKNTFTNQVDKWFNTSQLQGNAKGIGGLIKNAILPFAKFPTTMLYNTLTDRNIIADAAHFGISVKRGDVDGMTKALSGAIVDGGGGALGWHLVHSGLITNKDDNGYSDGGLYLHMGNRSIPLGLLGVGAESLIGGASMAMATGQKGGNPLEHFIKGIGDTFLSTFKMAGGQSLIGGGNQSLTSVQNLVANKPGTNLPDTLATVGSQGLSQWIPSTFGDINAGLNMTSLNPNHEAALTKVTKGASGDTTSSGALSTAKDIVPSAINSMINRIPVASQLVLPRNPAIAATDPIDRLTRGTHLNPPQVASLQKAADIKSQALQDYNNGIPVYTKVGEVSPRATALPQGYNYTNTLNTAIQTGKYDNAIKGLQGELAAMNTPGPDHIPPSAKEAVQDHIAQLNVFKNLNIKADFIDKYSSTTDAQWRAMGDSTSDTYDPATYQKLYTLDQALVNAGVSGGSITSAGKGSTPKFTVPKSSGSSVKSNTIGSLLQPARESFVNNLLQPAQNLNLPEAKLTAPGTLIAPRKISVGLPKA